MSASDMIARGEFGSRDVLAKMCLVLGIKPIMAKPPAHQVYHSDYFSVPFHINEQIPPDEIWLKNSYGRLLKKIKVPLNQYDPQNVKIIFAFDEFEIEDVKLWTGSLGVA